MDPHGGAFMIAGILLAAGMSTRMGRNKLLIDVEGRPMVACAADAALAAGLDPVVVVTGHDAGNVRAALAGRSVVCVHNPDYVTGMLGSLKAGITALPGEANGAVVCLGDMPDVTAAHIACLLAAFDGERRICVPVCQGRRGHPVVFGRAYFPEILSLEGDVGARAVVRAHADAVRQVDMDDEAILTDLDTPESLAAYRGN